MPRSSCACCSVSNLMAMYDGSDIWCSLFLDVGRVEQRRDLIDALTVDVHRALVVRRGAGELLVDGLQPGDDRVEVLAPLPHDVAEQRARLGHVAARGRLDGVVDLIPDRGDCLASVIDV